MQGSYGPFRPNIEVEVPFWLAIAFYKRKSCRIKPPAWLATDRLQGKLLAGSASSLSQASTLESHQQAPRCPRQCLPI